MERCHIKYAEKKIEYLPTNSFYEVLAADGFRQEGLNASAIIFDELHTQKKDELYSVLKKRQSAREEPLFIMITTAGWDRESVCWRVHEHAQKIQDGTLEEPHFHAFIVSAPEDAAWTDDAVWKKYNPGLGDFKSLDKMREEFAEAMDIPAEQDAFRRYHLDQWRYSKESLFDMTIWIRNKTYVRAGNLAGQTCWGGLDLAETQDFASLCQVFNGEGESVNAIWTHWYPEDGLHDKAKQMKVPLKLWADQGYITLVSGNTIDFDWIEKEISKIAQTYVIAAIGYDPWKAHQIATKLGNQGLNMINMRQGHQTLGAATGQLMRMIKAEEFNHGNNPLVTWMFSNAIGRRDVNDNVVPDRKNSGGKIDGVASGVMAMTARASKPPSIYETGGIRYV
jgi:phage terminase large subunit-like protein